MFVYLQTTPSHYADLSESIELLNACQVYDAECVSKIKTILSIIFIFTIWGCVSSAYPIILWWSRECVLYLIIIIKPEVWTINHCLGLGHETMVCAVCLTMFLLLVITCPKCAHKTLKYHYGYVSTQRHLNLAPQAVNSLLGSRWQTFSPSGYTTSPVEKGTWAKCIRNQYSCGPFYSHGLA